MTLCSAQLSRRADGSETEDAKQIRDLKRLPAVEAIPKYRRGTLEEQPSGLAYGGTVLAIVALQKDPIAIRRKDELENSGYKSLRTRHFLVDRIRAPSFPNVMKEAHNKIK